MPCYYSGAGNGTNCFELYNKDRLQPDIEIIGNNINEVINSLGQKIDYWVNTYNLSSADNLYGEDPTSTFYGPTRLKMYISLNENALALSKFGWSSDDEVTGYIAFIGYTNAFASTSAAYANLNQAVEPKSGDIFSLVEYGNDRPGVRGENYFQVTERVDQDIAELNPLGGHYMWRLKAKRLEYSYQPGLTGERGNSQVYDNTFSGVVSSINAGLSATEDKTYPGNANTTSKNMVFNMPLNNDTSVYGAYE